MNMIGLSFTVVMDQFIMMSFAQVMQIPVDYPVFSREIVNQMYSPSAFFLAKQLVSMFTFFFYPFITSLSSFYFLGFPDTSFDKFMHYAVINALAAYCGSQYGFTMGTIFSDCMMAVNANHLSILLLTFGGGLAANIGQNSNLLVRALSYVAPQRYAGELMMREVLQNNAIFVKIQILNFFGYTAGEEYCVKYLIGFFFFMFFLGWLTMIYKTHYNCF